MKYRLVRLLQSANAYCPMLVTLPGIVTLVRLVQSANALFPMQVTPFGDRYTGKAGAARERNLPDANDAARNRDIGETGAMAHQTHYHRYK